MSHNRSFQYMSIDEHFVKKEFDNYRMHTLQEPVLKPIKKYGFKGVDETIYVLAHKLVPGLRKNKIEYYANQIRRTELEIINRPNEELSEEYKKILSVEPNPATFNVLGTERKNLRRQRISRMAKAKEELYPSEQWNYTKNKIENKVYAPLEALGKTGEFIKQNILWIATAATITGVAYSGNNWLRQAKIYDGVASEYVLSHEVGQNTLPLKRDIPEELIYCGINLTHTPEVNISIGDDSEITIPEKMSEPQLARINILNMENTLTSNLSNNILESYRKVTPNDKSQLAQLRNSAMSSFQTADIMLAGKFDGTVSYTAELAVAAIGNNTVQNAVSILESYMNPSIVQKENDAHAKLSFWKWLSIGGIVAGSILGTSAYKTSQNRRWRNRYY